MTTPDLHALAEEAAAEYSHNKREATTSDLVGVIKHALAKLQQQHEAEGAAAVAEALERACDAVVANCVACDGRGWTGDSKIIPDCCGQYSCLLERCCGNAVPKQVDARQQCEYCGRQVEAIRSIKPRSDMVCVPKEPTDAMIMAAIKAWDDRNYYATRGYVNEGDASLCYEAMLAAADGKT